ncbi:DHH family phosphoesterase [Litoribacterium kuwaitense]|uniref:DHH family phosphoesterase n=1 Tax=Litoribacterium kuwaitense TaxID=1398745 RepID=UPI001BAB8919|nr:bifunctional oligoribonuclease/PAP phosphatase NrnA [Litoribacterium kuwaitense]
MNKLLDYIKDYSKIVIHRHVRPDPDAYGSQCSLAEIIQANFPEKQVRVVGQEVDSLKFLYRMDDVPDDFYAGSLVLVCDTANKERVDDQRYALGEVVVKIDHHPNDDPYGQVNWVETSASSTSEMVYEWYSAHKGELTLPVKAAELIFAGIVGDTGRFMFPSASPKTFQYASELVQYSFSRPALYESLYEIKENVLRLQGHILQTFTLAPEGVAQVRLSTDMLESFNVTPMEASQLVGTLGNVAGIRAWVFFIEEENIIRIRLRSKGPVINQIARQYDGGGHPLAAGASIVSWEKADEVVEKIKEACLAASSKL